MQLTFDADVEAFRAEFVAFLDEHLPSEAEAVERPRSTSHIPDWARRWQRLLFDHGWLLPGYPPEFGGRNATILDDPEFSLALLQAYNDWHVEEWCGAYPARFIPMTLPVIWDAEACAKEVRRNAKRGVHALTFTENPAAMGYPSFHDDYWTPLWEALVDTDTVMNVHIGSSGRLAITAPDAPMDVMITLQPMNIVQAAADLLWSKPIKKYPDLKIALSEGGTGWIPYFLERADRTYEMHSTWTGQDFKGKLPSEVFREHFLTCFISDPIGVRLRREIGVDNICWEADYPHFGLRCGPGLPSSSMRCSPTTRSPMTRSTR